jgi:prepilin-type N-terminal cleavage/methylation domain-containing protein
MEGYKMLQNLMRKMKKGDKGFTLVELMIVVIIIGILIAIAIPIYRNIQSNAELRACQANLRSIKSQLEVWKADETNPGNVYPLTSEFHTTFMADSFEGDEPECPQTDTVYTYVSASGITYTLTCVNGHTL